jgi:hypothetical protein
MCSNRPSVRYVSSILEVPETQNCTAFVRGGAKLYWIYPILGFAVATCLALATAYRGLYAANTSAAA